MSHNDLATQASTLGDRSHQKRELAAISVEMTVRQIMNSDITTSGHHALSSISTAVNQNRSAAEIIYRRTDQIQKVIHFLMTNYIDSEQANYRKGGLLGLAGVMIALTTKRNELSYEGMTFLNQVIPIIQKCLDDKDASVRYYANETLYNVMFVSRYHIIQFFDLIFKQIQILCDDEDELVRESNKSVNRLLQDVACNYDDFDIGAFIAVLQQLIRSKSLRVRILALDWIIALDAEPDIYFLVYLHHFLNALFALIVDHRRIIHKNYKNYKSKDTQLTQEIMADFLEEISEYLQRNPSDIHRYEQFDINRIVVNLVDIIMLSNDIIEDSDDCVLDNDDSASDLEIDIILEYRKQVKQQSHKRQSSGYGFGVCATQKSVALKWLDTFIRLGGDRLKKLYPKILHSILFAMKDKRIQKSALILNQHLMDLVIHETDDCELIMDSIVSIGDGDGYIDDIINELKTENGLNAVNKYDSFDIVSVMNILIDALQNNKDYAIESRIEALKWISELLMDCIPFINIPNDKLLSVCFERLCDADNHDNADIRMKQNRVTNMTIKVLSLLSKHPSIFEQILTNLLCLFYKKPSVLQNKGKLIITQLCQLLDCTKIYSVLANLILSHGTKRMFVRSMVRLMNLILLTTKELYPLREIIKKCHDNQESKNIFLVLYKTWSYSPISLISLCLLAQRYDLGLMLVNQFKKDIFLHKSVQFLLEIDELIHLLESPIFLHLRLQLLCLDDSTLTNCTSHDSDQHQRPKWSQIFQIVNALLTLLPNSNGFHQFRVRIQMVSLYKRLFSKLAKQANNPQLVNDKIINDAMYCDPYDNQLILKDKEKEKENDNTVHINFSDKHKLFQQYIDSQTRMQKV